MLGQVVSDVLSEKGAVAETLVLDAAFGHAECEPLDVHGKRVPLMVW